MRVTLNDIAKKVGVTPSTVQRALNNVEGVSQEKRDIIQKIANEMGYKRNIIASSLKKGSSRIALVLPEPSHNNRYYAHYLWEGVERYLKEFTEFSIITFKYTYERKENLLGEKLNEVLIRHGHELDGLLTMGTEEPNALSAFKKFKEKRIPIVLVGTEANKDSRLCCVKTNDELVGRMAADLLINFGTYEQHSHLLLTGDFTIKDQYYNAMGFEKRILESGLPFEIVKLANDSDLTVVKEGIKNMLNSRLNIGAIFSCSARNTVPMCRAVAETSAANRIHMIGSDIFPESIEFIDQGALNAIIHKRPSSQAFTAMQTLMDYILKGIKPSNDTLFINSVIVLKSNIEYYTQDSE